MNLGPTSGNETNNQGVDQPHLNVEVVIDFDGVIWDGNVTSGREKLVGGLYETWDDDTDKFNTYYTTSKVIIYDSPSLAQGPRTFRVWAKGPDGKKHGVQFTVRENGVENVVPYDP